MQSYADGMLLLYSYAKRILSYHNLQLHWKSTNSEHKFSCMATCNYVCNRKNSKRILHFSFQLKSHTKRMHARSDLTSAQHSGSDFEILSCAIKAIPHWTSIHSQTKRLGYIYTWTKANGVFCCRVAQVSNGARASLWSWLPAQLKLWMSRWLSCHPLFIIMETTSQKWFMNENTMVLTCVFEHGTMVTQRYL